MTYLPLTRLIAAAGGVVLPLMAGDAMAMPASRTSEPVQSQSAPSSGMEARDDIRKSSGFIAGSQRIERKDVDK